MNARMLGHLVAQRAKQADMEDLAAGAAIGGGGYAAQQFGSAAMASRKYRVPGFLDASRELWNGPAASRLGQYVPSWSDYHRIRELAANSPLRFKLMMSGLLPDSQISARNLANIRRLTFNTPYEVARKRLGDVILHLSSENYKNPYNRVMLAAQQFVGGGSLAHADFDTGGKIPGLNLPKGQSAVGLWPPEHGGVGGQYVSFDPAVSPEDTANATSIRLRPQTKITPQVAEQATPGIQAIYGQAEPHFNPALMGRITANEVAGESAQPVSRGLGMLSTFLQKHKLLGRARQLGLQNVVKQVILPQLRPGVGEVCSTSVAKALRAVDPQLMAASQAATAAPSEFMRMLQGPGKNMDVLGMNLARQARKPLSLLTEHAMSYGPTAIRGGLAAGAGAAALWGLQHLANRGSPLLQSAATGLQAHAQDALSPKLL